MLCLVLGCLPGNDSSVVDTDSEETAPPDTAEAGLTGLQGRAVEAVVTTGSFEGREQVYFVSDSGVGTDICRFHYSLSSIAERQDCDSCDWAFDLAVSDTELLFEEEPGCLSTLGIDPSELALREGQVVSYGYTEEYFGHAQVVLMEVDSSWIAVANAAWDIESGVFSFDWREGYVGY